MTEGKADVMIERARSGRRCVFLTTDILMHAADKGAGAVQMLRMKSNSVARSCPRELLQMVFAGITVWNTKLHGVCTVLECVICAGEMALRRQHTRSENV